MHGFRDAGQSGRPLGRLVPSTDLPHTFNPPRGYVASANQRIVPTDYPEPIYGAYSQGHRGVRIDQVFAAAAGRPRGRDRIAERREELRAERLCPTSCATSPARTRVAIRAVRLGFGYTLDSTAPTVFETFMSSGSAPCWRCMCRNACWI